MTIDVLGINRTGTKKFINLYFFRFGCLIYSPFVIIVSAIGNQDPETDDFSLITWCKSKVKFTNVIEATTNVFSISYDLLVHSQRNF